jgi:SAM-dependent methyltransferase
VSLLEPTGAPENIIAKYICPRTGRPLRFDGEELHTVSSSSRYPVRLGIPQFLCFEPAEDAQTKAQLEQLNQLARKDGWRAALANVYGEDAPILRYVTEPARASFIDLLPLNDQSEVLEIGPGLGQFTTFLANRAKFVHALEVVKEQAEFASERCRQMGTRNVQFAAGGDDCRLPYAAGTFDVVVLNLVFEWCASRCSNERDSEVQRRLLSEIFRVLRPCGSLYLATKNRFALSNLIGKRDEHCHNLRFGSALPRWLAQVVMRAKGHKRPLGRLYSHNELKSMLHDAGFTKVESFWAVPEMRRPAHYVCTDGPSVRTQRKQKGFVQGEMRSTAVIMPIIPASIVKHVSPGLAFLATKAPNVTMKTVNLSMSLDKSVSTKK